MCYCPLSVPRRGLTPSGPRGLGAASPCRAPVGLPPRTSTSLLEVIGLLCRGTSRSNVAEAGNVYLLIQVPSPEVSQILGNEEVEQHIVPFELAHKAHSLYALQISRFDLHSGELHLDPNQ